MPRLVILAALVLVGMTLGRLPVPWWSWLLAVLLACGLLLRGHGRWPWLAGIIMVSAAWSGLHRQAVAGNDLMVLSGYDTPRQLVCLQGIVTSISGIRLQLQVTGWRTPTELIPARGRVVIRLTGGPDQPLAGRTIQVMGWLNPVRAPVESGEPDWQSLALDGTYRGWMELESLALLKTVDQPGHLLAAWRGRLQSMVTRQVLAPPVPATGPVRSLLAALLLGQRDHHWADVAPPFRRLGVAHLLAISGLHLGLVAGMVLLVVRVRTGPRRWHGWIVFLSVGAYLSVVELRPPIVRAGVMTILAGVGLLNHRRFTGIGLLAVAAIVVVSVQPGQVARPGFQLSFGVVAALLLLATRLRHRWFGPRSWMASRPSTVLIQWTFDAVAASVTAWVISIPVVVGHFGQWSPVAVPMSLLLLPIVALLLALGVLRALLGWVPGVGEVSGSVLVTCSEWVLAVVDGIDRIPATSIEGLEVSWPWVVLATCWSVAWCGLQRRRHLLLPALLLLLTWVILGNLVHETAAASVTATIVCPPPE